MSGIMVNFILAKCSNHLISTTNKNQSDANIEDYTAETLEKVLLHKVTPVQHDFNLFSPNFGFVRTKRFQKKIV
jgi:ABC-type uncharacterized transport system permease subunit